MSKEIKWAPIIPLIGGFPLGAEAAINQPPQAIYSYDGFQKNDEHYVNYQNNILGRGIPYIIDDDQKKGDLDIVVATPPCAALSQLNTGKSAEVKGSGCAKNEWMYVALTDAIEKHNAKVVLIENAPALYTNKGQGVADKLYEICKEHGYSLTLYKTSTKYHGIPQNRDRCFAIAWRSETAPYMDYYERERKSFEQYLEEVDDDTLLHQGGHESVINPKISNEPYFNFIRHKTGKDPRDVLIEAKTITCFNWVNDNGLLEEARDWFEETDNEVGLKYAEHAIYKFSIGKGTWDGSTHIFDDAMNACIGRNMNDTIHPKYDRSMTIREAFHIMGFPLDFELVNGRRSINHIAQNVPVCTARDMVLQAVKFLNGELEMSESDMIKQSNYKQEVQFESKSHENTITLF